MDYMNFLGTGDFVSGQAINQEENNKDNLNYQNIQVLHVARYSNFFELQLKTKVPQVNKKLIIEKTGKMYELDINDNRYENEKPTEILQFSFFLGIQYILDKPFLLCAENVVHVCTIQKNDIFEVASLAFMTFEKPKEIFQSEKGKEIENHIRNIKKLFAEGYYFSYTYNLSLSKQKQAFQSERDARFCWNSHSSRELIANQVSSVWSLPLIQGYVGYFNVYLQGKKLDFYLIARRSCKKAGTRYNSRGIDDDGNVANYTEIEQLFYYNQFCCAHLQIRGSVPVFWRQRGITAQTKITRSYELTNQAFLKHFEDIKRNYQYVLCVNLMKKSKESEHILTESFETHIKNNSSILDFVRYKYYDFHTICRNQKYENVNPTIRQLHKMNDNFKFYAEDIQNNIVIVTQKGVVRTNCLDCLDRTNVFQSKIALDILNVQLNQLGVNLQDQFGEDPLDHVDSTELNHPFVKKFKCIWADCGDMISKHYTGTGSTHTDVTKKGKRDFLGLLQHGYKSISRFYFQNFEDNIKQEAIDMVVGQHTESVNTFNESIEKELISRQEQYCTFQKITVRIFTWNVSGNEPVEKLNLFDFEKGKSTPDIVVIGLQEIIELNAKNLVSVNNEQEIKKWDHIILDQLNFHDNYILTKHKDLYGCLLLVYTKQRYHSRISKINDDTVKLGYISSKGSVAIKLYFDDTSISFLNVHLDIGLRKNIISFNDVHSKSFQQEGVGKTKDEKLENIDYSFLLGDTGSTTTLTYSQMMELIQNYERQIKINKDEAASIMKQMRENDELLLSKEYSDYLLKYEEATINFLPTYNYEQLSLVYDQNTTPCWSDRIMILAREGNFFKQNGYQRKEINVSSHRPVWADYELNIKKVDQYKKEQILNKIYAELNTISEKIEKEDI